MHERFLRVITIQDFWIVRVATQICDINFVFEGRIFYSLSFGSSRETVTSQDGGAHNKDSDIWSFLCSSIEVFYSRQFGLHL